jgi:hypothetical protein
MEHQHVLARIARDVPLSADGWQHFVSTLVTEPDHEDDADAIRVSVGNSALGYLPRQDAQKRHRTVAEVNARYGPYLCPSILVGGETEDRNYGVRVSMWHPTRREVAAGVRV